jgi:phosphohistidine swiveling domain-containing protein
MGERLDPVIGYVRRLADAGDAGLSELGGKGESLARLVAAGLPVPDGFCITTAAYERFLAEAGPSDALPDHLAEPVEMRRLFDERPIPSAVVGPVLEAYAALGEPAVAVRSSATVEDLAEASAAGQQETFLNVHGHRSLLQAVRRCWASLWSDRAVAYRRRLGLSEDGLGLAVVVQRLVDADAAGILFTADPATGSSDLVQINASWGLGEAVVGGEVSPDSFRVEAASGRLLSMEVGEKQTMTVRARVGTRSEPVPRRRRRAASLSPSQAERLAAIGLRIAELAGCAVDVEWCRRGDDLYVVQARPISASAASPRDPWNDSRYGYCLWTNTNVGEAMPDVLTPLTWSMVQLFLHDIMATSSIPPYVSYGRIGGRVYLNLSVVFTLAAATGVPEHRIRRLTEEVFGHVPDDVEIPRVPASRLTVLRASVPVAWHVLRTARRDAPRFQSYLELHPELCRQRRARIAAVGDPVELSALWRTTILPGFHEVTGMLSAATRSSGASFVTVRKRLQRLVGDADAGSIIAGLGGATGHLASLDLLHGLDAVAAGEIDRETFNERYGHRGPHEFEIATRRPGEDPGWLEAQLAERGHAGADYRGLLASQAAGRGAAWRRLRRAHPVWAGILGHQLRMWTRIAGDREHARSEVVRYFWVLRAYAVRAGELGDLGEDAFFLPAEGLAAVLDGAPPDRPAIAAARAAYEAYRRLPAYPGLILGRFDPFSWAVDPARRSDRYVEGGGAGASEIIRGFPGSAGVVEAPARVILDAKDGAELRAGEVLVTAVTNVGWTPMFPRASAVVTDVGAPLSHAAIVARELGLPAVVGCGNATMLLRSGDWVRVDGSAGTVERLDSPLDPSLVPPLDASSSP